MSRMLWNIFELKKALSFKKRVVVPYICTQCQQDCPFDAITMSAST